MANEMYTVAETNLITVDEMKKVREVDFVNRFAHNSLSKLLEVLGVTRKVPLMEGTTMYVYSTDGTLQNGEVAEGDIIPLSQFETTKTAVGEITLKKWRKAVSAEAIQKSGYNAAVRDTDAALLKKVQGGVRTSLFSFLNDVDLSAMTKAELLEYAEANGIEGVNSSMLKADIYEIIANS